MKNPMVKVGIIAGVMALLTIVAIIYSAMSSYSVSCEVCITFKGETVCRTGQGRTRADARQTAATAACAVLPTDGMADRVKCADTEPSSITCK